MGVILLSGPKEEWKGRSDQHLTARQPDPFPKFPWVPPITQSDLNCLPLPGRTQTAHTAVDKRYTQCPTMPEYMCVWGACLKYEIQRVVKMATIKRISTSFPQTYLVGHLFWGSSRCRSQASECDVPWWSNCLLRSLQTLCKKSKIK